MSWERPRLPRCIGDVLRSAAILIACLAFLGGPAAAKEPRGALAYANDARGSLDVYVLDAGATRPRLVAASRTDDFSPSWSPGGAWLAYRVNPQRGDEGDIWVVRADGTGRRNPTRSPGVADWSPAWSPDGRSIAYCSFAGGGGDVWVMRPNGSQRRNLTRDGSLNEYPSWAPDRRSIAFGSHRDGQFEIYRMARDGSRQVNPTLNPAKDQWAAWSPDGRRIAFMSDRDGNEDVFLMTATGLGVRNVTHTRALDQSHPAWLPDGRLTFTRHAETGPIELWVTRPSGSGARLLAIDAQPVFAYDWLGG